MARKYARILVSGDHLFPEANSFQRVRTQLEENCELRGKDNVQGQISEHIFASGGGYYVLLFIKYFSQNEQFGKYSPGLAVEHVWYSTFFTHKGIGVGDGVLVTENMI